MRYTGDADELISHVRAMTESDGRRSNEFVDGDALAHEFKNHLSVIVGFCELLLRELPEGDPKRGDVLQMRRAGIAAIELLPRLFTRM